MVQNKASDLDRSNPGIKMNQPGNIPNGESSELHASFSMIMSHLKNIESEDVANKLKAIVNENLELKETVAQNNLAIRQQLTLLMQWNQQVQQQQQLYRQQAEESARQIITLQQENSMLLSKIGDDQKLTSRPSQGILDEENLRTINERLDSTSALLKMKKEENKVLLDQKTRLEGDITLLKCDLSTSHSEFDKMQQQQINLISTIKDLQIALQKERLSHVAPTTILERVIGASSNGIHEEVANLKSQLETERDSSSTFQLRLQKSQDEVASLSAGLESARKEMSEFKIKCLREEVSNASSSTSSFKEKKMSDADKRRVNEESAMLKEEVISLEIALNDERARASDDRAEMSRMHSEIGRLKSELMDAGQNSERNKLNDHYYQAKLKSIHEQHDEATAKLISYEELLGSKNEEIARLKKEYGEAKAKLTETNSEGDLIAVLRAQVEVYQGDFRAEREAREQMATDREKLRDEIRHLHARNIQLMDELENYQRRQFPAGSNQSSRSASEEPVTAHTTLGAMLSPDSLWDKLSSTSDKKDEELKKKAVDDIDEALLYCPKCNKSFTQLRPLEEHVNRCLDED